MSPTLLAFCITAPLAVGTASAGSLADLLKQKLDAKIDDVTADVTDVVFAKLRDSFPAVTKMTGMKPVPADYGDKVTVFGFDGCPYCRKLTAYLRAEGIDYVNMDVEHNPSAKREFRRLGGGGVPLTIVGSESVHGFNAAMMSEFLREHGIDGA